MGRRNSFVQRLELMAHFPVAREHRWFRESLAHLESFRTEDGRLSLPGALPQGVAQRLLGQRCVYAAGREPAEAAFVDAGFDVQDDR